MGYGILERWKAGGGRIRIRIKMKMKGITKLGTED